MKDDSYLGKTAIVSQWDPAIDVGLSDMDAYRKDRDMKYVHLKGESRPVKYHLRFPFHAEYADLLNNASSIQIFTDSKGTQTRIETMKPGSSTYLGFTMLVTMIENCKMPDGTIKDVYPEFSRWTEQELATYIPFFDVVTEIGGFAIDRIPKASTLQSRS